MGTMLQNADAGEADAYLYFFSHTPPEKGLQGCRRGLTRSARSAYAYDNLGADHDADLHRGRLLLRDQMSGYWVAFARTGDPNAPTLPDWPTVETAPDRVMEFSGDGSRMTDRPRADAIDFSMEYEGRSHDHPRSVRLIDPLVSGRRPMQECRVHHAPQGRRRCPFRRLHAHAVGDGREVAGDHVGIRIRGDHLPRRHARTAHAGRPDAGRATT